MSRKYTRIQVLEANIYQMKEEGKTNREIAGELGLELKQIKNLINRHNHAKAANEEETMPRPMGRPRKDGQPPHPRQDTEIHRYPVTVMCKFFGVSRSGYYAYVR